MDSLAFLLQGFGSALTPTNLLFCAIGSLAGTIVGILPGIGPTAGIAILLPLCAGLPPAPAIIMLAGIYYGAMYGGSTTAILINVPGEASSVPTALDGYQLALQGNPGVALAISALGSFVAGTLGLVGLTFFAPLLASWALAFGPPEYFAVMMLALSVVIGLAGKSLVKGLLSALIGFAIALVGLDPITGDTRLTFGFEPLVSGIDFVSVVVGLFAFAEVFGNVGRIQESVYVRKVGRLMLTAAELVQSLGAILRGGTIGFVLGLLPGSSPSASAFLAYDFERRTSKNPERFGRGALEGVAAPESANNATSSANFIPLMALGIPSSAPLAVLVGGFMVYGLQPGPMLFQQHAAFAWTVIASMYVGNVMLLLINLPLIGMWARLVRVPYPVLATLVVIFGFIGSYSVRNSLFDVWVALAFGIVGFMMKRFEYPTTPLVLCVILAPIIESSLGQTLSMSRGDLSLLASRPIALLLLAAALISIAAAIYARWKNRQAIEMMLSDTA